MQTFGIIRLLLFCALELFQAMPRIKKILDNPAAKARIQRAQRAMHDYMGKHGLTQAQLAERIIGKPNGDWTSRAMSAGVGIMDNLDAIAAVCETTPAYLYCGLDTASIVTIEQVRAIVAEEIRRGGTLRTELLDDLEKSL